MSGAPQLSADEVVARLEGIRAGPWSHLAQRHAGTFNPTTGFEDKLFEDASEILLPDLDLAESDRSRLAKLSHLLRFHWDEDIEDGEVAKRDSFDEALAVPQFYELAVVTGYLRLDDVWVDARRRLVRLLWSPAARRYVRGYGLVTVESLAARVRVRLDEPQVDPPPAQAGNERHFAALLAEYRHWYEDEGLYAWLTILDDINYGEATADDIYILLQGHDVGRRVAADATVALAGMLDFSARLSRLSRSLSEAEKPIYGAFVHYWLAKYFGQELRKGRFRKTQSGCDWSRELRQLIARQDPELSADFEIEQRELRRLWKAAKKRIRTML